ncbi:hypothetical protein FUSO4_12875 [Fusobacterium necrophorum DJ-1]|uniref:Fe/B12 periplasmic-binding domain-containing protein n=2 Tax=Fusobacterium necrophorum TaxID=859 RepID=A0AB73BVR8_9FUSO|nr:hypothetical protein [Fusobacterium necrophorum]KDE60678.1 hypothetical protein FUSO4_12875 [Fusobacterium necrophorum DJ-1]KDE62676.1 hypothetical protein FUSO5_09285 [Fusobacterium necrophorum BFTR-1]KDE62724.1 hypothetical protein FUSO3_07150 [Fusobacterium necrophorum BL]KDE71774.1 hypothetical protein FUSO8_07525 [Fusobacterium necrophorum DJ-2]SQC98550.1 Uncharacterised protein [Fusobacterium necrophorum subsp. necrophorum]
MVNLSHFKNYEIILNGRGSQEIMQEYKPDILVSDPVYKNLVHYGTIFILLLHYDTALNSI